MKETISFPVQAGTLQSTIDWKRVIRTATRKAGRTVINLLGNYYTPWGLTLLAVALMCYGIAIGCILLYKGSAIASIVPFAWGLLNELKNTNTDEL